MQCFTIMSSEIEGRLDLPYYAFEALRYERRVREISSKTLGDFVLRMAGGATPRIDESDQHYTDDPEIGIPFLRVQNVSVSGELDLNNLKYITPQTHSGMLKRSQVRAGNLVVKITDVGRMAVSAVIPEGFVGNINQHLVVIETDSEATSLALAAFLNTDVGEKLASRRSTGGTRPALDYKALLSIPVVVNPQIMALVKEAYASKKAKEAEAEQLLASIDNYVLSELGITLPEAQPKTCFTIMASEVQGSRIDAFYHQPHFKAVAESLNTSRYEFGELGSYITKINYGASVKNTYTDTGIPLLRILNLKPNRFALNFVAMLPESMRKEIGSGFVDAGDFLISRSGSIGIVAIVPKEADKFAFGSFMIRFKLADNVSHPFISIWLNTKVSQLLLQRAKIGAIQGNITIDTIKSIPIPLPPLDIQQRIAAEVQQRMERAQALKREAAAELESAKQQVEAIILGKA